MRELVALVISASFAIFFCRLFLHRKYDYKGLALLLGVSALIGLAIANYDRIGSVDVWGLKVQAKQIQDETIQEIRKEVDSQRAALAEDMQRVNEAITKSQKVLSDLQAESQFYSTALAAQADDRRAFDQLRSWSEEKNNPFAARAEAAWIAVFKSHNVGMFEAGFTIPWNVGVEPSKLTLADLKKSYATAPSTLKPALIEYIATKRTDLPLHDRDQFLIDVIRDDSSLSAVEYAGRYLNQLNKLNKAPLAIDYYLQWWNDNKQRVQ